MSMADSASRDLSATSGGSEQGANASGGAMTFPDQIRLASDDRIPAPHLATGNGFKNEAVAPGIGQLHHHRHRRIQIGGKAGMHKLVAPGRPARFEIGEIGNPGHQGNCV
jgi:hypothetical protein